MNDFVLRLAEARPDLLALCREVGAAVFYLVGSQARGQTLPMSDVDFAVLFKPEVRESSYAERQERLIVEIIRILGRNDVDVIVLERSSALLKHRAATEGIVLFEASSGRHADFLVRSLREYDDTRALRAAVAASLDMM